MVKSIVNGVVTYFPSTRSGQRIGAHYEISAGAENQSEQPNSKPVAHSQSRFFE
jgi:hypothetical protein